MAHDGREAAGILPWGSSESADEEGEDVVCWTVFGVRCGSTTPSAPAACVGGGLNLILSYKALRPRR